MTHSVPFKVGIPARYAATRLPGKPLRLLAGKPLVQHVYERALASGADEVFIATDDQRIVDAAASFGANVYLTSEFHQSGTDRIAEVASDKDWSEDTIIVNLQGDEPLINPELVFLVAQDLARHENTGVASMCTPITQAQEVLDPHAVKVVMDREGFALYFSRSVLPWSRDITSTIKEYTVSPFFRHIGLYAYRCGFLSQFSNMEPCDLEKSESLEQLRVLWNGYRIHMSVVQDAPHGGVDTEQDLARAQALLNKHKN